MDAPAQTDNASEQSPDDIPWFAPYANASIFRYVNWMSNGHNQKSIAECHRLVKTMSTPDFNVDDLEGVNLQKELKRLDDEKIVIGELPDLPKSTWKTIDLKIPVPDGKSHQSFDDVHISQSLASAIVL